MWEIHCPSCGILLRYGKMPHHCPDCKNPQAIVINPEPTGNEPKDDSGWGRFEDATWPR